MRTFILRLQKGSTGNFSLDDLPSAGHMEIACQTIANALWVSNNVRADTVVHIVCDGSPEPPKTVSIYGDTIQGLTFDERGIAMLLLNALKKKIVDRTLVSPGIYVEKKSFESLVKEQKGTLYYLHKKGDDVRDTAFGENPVFIFGDHTGIPKNTEKFLAGKASRINVGPAMLFASQCVTLVHNELDRRTSGVLSEDAFADNE